MYDERFLRRAIDLASANIDNGGGPFGAVVVRDGEVIAESGNRVTADHDPTAHAEVMAIRLAAKKLNDFSLRGCDIYASCEPCPMCLATGLELIMFIMRHLPLLRPKRVLTIPSSIARSGFQSKRELYLCVNTSNVKVNSLS